ncbi:hypothetical protein L6279_02765 [Candidatus Parcubacteria bacterium]|nr:hypothetical protein [Candidatus Parcubacteria bacterium]
MNQPVTMKDLGEFTDEVLLPGVELTIKQSEKRLGQKIETNYNGIQANYNGIQEIMKTLKEMQKSIQRLEIRQDKESLEIRVIDWLTNRVVVLEKKLGIVPEPMPQEQN